MKTEAVRGRHDDRPRTKLQASHIYRDLRELMWPRRNLFFVGLLLVFINRAAGLVLPGSTKYLIDDVVQKHRQELLIPIVAAVGVAVLIQAVTSYSLIQLLSTSAQRLIADMRIRVQEHIGRLPVRYYDANKTGALVSRIMSDVEGVRNLVGTGLVEFIGGLFTAVIAFGLLLKINATLTLVALGFLLIFGLILRKAFTSIRPIFRERGKINAEVTGRLTESLGGVRVVKGFHAEAREAAVFEAGALRLFENVRRSLFATSIIGLASTLLMGIVSVTVMVVGGRLLLAGTMTIGDFFAFTLYLGFMVAPVFQMVGIGTQITEAFAGLDRMHEVLGEQPEDVDPVRTVRLERIQGNVRFENVTFEYEPGKPVLHGITLDAPSGAVTALVGSSGSGKSTLIGLVAAFAKPTTGSVCVDGIDVATVRLDSYRSQLGVVLQDNFLFDGTIKENILFGRPSATDNDVLVAAQIARVDEFALKLDNGFDTVVGERGVKLSGGQRQRVAIARAILADPRILILDEATSSLDTESEAMIQEGLAALMKGRTTFVIAHRLSTIRSADQILVLEEGVIVERGNHRELLARSGRYFDLYMRQAGLEANRFINPGEKEPEPDVETAEKRGETREGVGEVARDLLGFTRR
ncbi:MAG: ABC transporter permease [Acidobacteria bacterium 13_1_20CM_2_57_8]|nr:MAG: ABC transporter permease [Acidobacteria bacterium 13_1_20CM_2_57_8]